MLKRCLSALLTALFIISLAPSVHAQEEFASKPLPGDIYSQSAVLMDVATGQILYEKNMDQRNYPASITKIMTGALAAEAGAVSGFTTMTAEAIDSVDRASTHIALTYDEEVAVQDLYYAMLMMSANDASNGIAQVVGGSLPEFVALMNGKAMQLGAENTHFANAHGLHDPEHYTTAHDMALIARYALSFPEFRDAFGKRTHVMLPNNKQKDERHFYTQCAMMNPTPQYDERVIGGKLGWTDEAHHTMVILAKDHGQELLCVLMNSRLKYEKYKDAKLLLDYGFENFHLAEVAVPFGGEHQVPVTAAGEPCGEVTVSVPASVQVCLPAGTDASSVRVENDIPEEFSQLEENLTCTMTVTYPGGEKSGFSQKFPLTVDIPDKVMEDYKNQKALSMDSPVAQLWDSSRWMTWLKGIGFFLLFLLLAAVVVLYGIRLYNLHRRAVIMRNRRKKKAQKRKSSRN